MIPLGHRADEARKVAVRYGHKLTPWKELRDLYGRMMWFASCRVCGATAMAEFINEYSRETVASGNTQRQSCASIVKRKGARRCSRSRAHD